MYGDDLYASEVFANGEPSGLVADDGKHWTKQCPQESDWNNLTPDIYSSTGCSNTPAFVEAVEPAIRRKIW